MLSINSVTDLIVLGQCHQITIWKEFAALIIVCTHASGVKIIKSLGVWTTNGNTCSIFYSWYKALNTVSLLAFSLVLLCAAVIRCNMVQHLPLHMMADLLHWPTLYLFSMLLAAHTFLLLPSFSYFSLYLSTSTFQQSHSHCPSASVCVVLVGYCGRSCEKWFCGQV